MEIIQSSQLYIAGYSIDIFGHGPIDRRILKLFPLSTLQLIEKPFAETQQLSGGFANISSNESIITLDFVSNVTCIKNRLDVLGYTLKRAIMSFELWKKSIVESLEKSETLDRVSPSFPSQDAFRTGREKLKAYMSFDIDDLQESISEIIHFKLRKVMINGRFVVPDGIQELLTRHLVCDGFSVIGVENKLLLLRFFLESVDENEKVNYSVDAGGLSIDELKEYYNGTLNLNDPDNRLGLRVLIATEGKTDKFYLENSLKKLYPEIFDLFYFLDFNQIEGSAKSLVQVIKSLAASEIPNLILALFDNDGEGAEALTTLQGIPFPKNIQILKYPDILLGVSYPVLDSLTNVAVSHENVNGKGCAIELYLGKDVLIDSHGVLYSLNTTYKSNQLNFSKNIKKAIYNKFVNKLEDDFIPENWLEMKNLIDFILLRTRNVYEES